MAQAHQVFIPQIDASTIQLDAIKDKTDHIIELVRPYSVVPDEGIAAAVWLTVNVIKSGIVGDIVECGVWRGGTTFAMLLAQKFILGQITRPVWMFDSFEGMDKPSPKDGKMAAGWYVAAKSGMPDEYNQNWCAASLSEVLEAAHKLNLDSHIIPRKGWYEETLGKDFVQPAQVCLLRVDCDWYDPCKLVLNKLAPRVPVGGVIALDDYYVWEGCTRATHEYLAENSLAWPIRSVQNFHGAWMVKKGN